MLLVEQVVREHTLWMQKRDPKEAGDAGGWQVQVWNLNGNAEEWYEGVKKRLDTLLQNEILDFPAVVTRAKRDIIIQVSEDLQESGLQADVFGEGRGQHASPG